MTRVAAVIGWPIAHSRSPAMHDAAFAACGIDARMEAIAVQPDDLSAEITRLRALPILGASVTVPHKVAIAALCDELSGPARELGAVNCLQIAGARMIGHNTDTLGFRDALAESGLDLRGKRAVILGAGGSARAIEHALRTGGAVVDVAARTPASVAWIRARPWSELPQIFATAALVVDCTPTGLDQKTDAEFTAQLSLAALPASATVATLVYGRRTQLLEAAASRGHRTLDGRLMLIHQAAHAFALWTGRPAPIDIMTRAFDAPT